MPENRSETTPRALDFHRSPKAQVGAALLPHSFYLDAIARLRLVRRLVPLPLIVSMKEGSVSSVRWRRRGLFSGEARR
jgi:hypothetical protein